MFVCRVCLTLYGTRELNDDCWSRDFSRDRCNALPISFTARFPPGLSDLLCIFHLLVIFYSLLLFVGMSANLVPRGLIRKKIKAYMVNENLIGARSAHEQNCYG